MKKSRRHAALYLAKLRGTEAFAQLGHGMDTVTQAPSRTRLSSRRIANKTAAIQPMDVSDQTVVFTRR